MFVAFCCALRGEQCLQSGAAQLEWSGQVEAGFRGGYFFTGEYFFRGEYYFTGGYLCVQNLKSRFMGTYGSVSAGREKWPFNVLFFLKVESPCDQT